MSDYLNSNQDQVDATGELRGEFPHRIIGNQVTVRQGGAQSIEADHLIIRQGGAWNAKATRMDLSQGAVVYARTDAASVNNSKVGGLLAGGDIHMDQSLSQVVVSKGTSTVDQSAVGILISNEVKVAQTTSIFLIAKRIEGNVTTLFGSRDALLFGAIAGLVIALINLLSKTFKRDKKGS